MQFTGLGSRRTLEFHEVPTVASLARKKVNDEPNLPYLTEDYKFDLHSSNTTIPDWFNLHHQTIVSAKLGVHVQHMYSECLN
jgi:hypothetical protein